MSGESIDATLSFAIRHSTAPPTEYADVTENVLKIARPVLEALKNPKIQPYFRSLSVRPVPRNLIF
jgi:hypothetical protein